MELVNLGPTDIKVSPVCIGGMSFGEVFPDFQAWVQDEDTARAVIKRALELGVNFIDTANVYSHGTSEEFIGRSLKNLGVPRDDVVRASKVFFNDGALSASAIAREIEGTLTRLGTDYLDLYIIHRFDCSTPIEETMEALGSLVKAGKVRALGASEMYAYQLHNMQVTAERNGWTPFASMQCHYNLLYREDERELLPVCRQYDMAITPYSPLASGHLARPEWESDSERGKSDEIMKLKYDSGREQSMAIVARVAELADKRGVPMSDIALAWLYARGATSPIVGCSKPSRVDDAVRALEVKLTSDEVACLEGPYIARPITGPLPRPEES